MKCAWINRWRREGRDVDITGSLVLGASRMGDVEYINKDLISKVRSPCARGIAEARHMFRNKMYENDGHLFKTNIFSNLGIRNRIGIMLGGGNIFGWVRYENVRHMVLDIKLEDLVEEDGIKSKEVINRRLGFILTNVEYDKLRDAINYIRGKFKPDWSLRGTGKTIMEWMAPIRKGSNKFRAIMSGRGPESIRKSNSRTLDQSILYGIRWK
jgi:hypothetical protein